MYPRYHASLAARHVEKFGEVATPSPKVIGAHSPKFKPIFESLLLKIVGGPHPQWGVHLDKFGEVAPLSAKVIGAHSPNFKPIFECLLLKIVGGPHPQWGVR